MIFFKNIYISFIKIFFLLFLFGCINFENNQTEIIINQTNDINNQTEINNQTIIDIVENKSNNQTEITNKTENYFENNCNFENILKKDECLFNLSKKTNNSSFCFEIYSQDFQDECFFYFSVNLSDFDFCPRLRDSNKRDICFLVSAVNLRNINDCYLIKNDDLKKECLEILVFPCIDLTEEKQQNICYAKAIGDVSICKFNECFFEMAKYKENKTICTENFKDALLYSCYSYVTGDNYCKNLTIDSIKDYCYFNLAKIRKSPLTCSNIRTNTIYEYDCYLEMAIYFLEPNHCLKIQDFTKQTDCLVSYSLKTKQKQGCELLSSRHFSSTRDICFRDVSLLNVNPGICEYIENSLTRRNCYNLVFNSEFAFPFEYCLNISNMEWKDNCYMFSASKNNDISICNFINNPSTKKSCLNRFN